VQCAALIAPYVLSLLPARDRIIGAADYAPLIDLLLSVFFNVLLLVGGFCCDGLIPLIPDPSPLVYGKEWEKGVLELPLGDGMTTTARGWHALVPSPSGGR
jgi:hypothetical protein